MFYKKKTTLTALLMLVIFVFFGCAADFPEIKETTDIFVEATETNNEICTEASTTSSVENIKIFDEFSGKAFVQYIDNIPNFSENDKTNKAFELYSPLDSLGRCGVAYANLCKELMPTEERGSIGSVKPSGWQTIKYDCVDGKYLYNRCHLIGFQLAAENANEKNLITGTRYLNIEGMLPFENMVADYIKETNNHVLYRVTPVYEGDNLVASGVIMEGWSVEDSGAGICFSVYCFNAQPQIEIDYKTGNSRLIGEEETFESSAPATETERDYVLNTNSKKFHLPTCSSCNKISDGNKEEFHGTRDELIADGYDPCGICKP